MDQYDGVDIKQLDHPKSRNFFIRTYNNLESVENVLEDHSETIKHAHYIVHNKDLVKTRHIHLVVVTWGVTTAEAVYKWFRDCFDDFGVYGNTFVQYANNIENCYQYLIHANAPEKERYDVSDIIHIGSSTACLSAIEKIPEFSASARCYAEYCKGASPSYLAKKYGRVFLGSYVNMQKARSEDGAISRVEAEFNDLIATLKSFGVRLRAYDSEIYVNGADDRTKAFVEDMLRSFYLILGIDYSCDNRFKEIVEDV